MLDADLASAFARVALANVQREYPRRLDQLLTTPDTEWRPRALHPAIFGSYDWHSAVHMHWLLALQAELRRSGRWQSAVEPLAAELADRFTHYVRDLPYPVRAGTHGNTAFACILALDYGMRDEIQAAALRWYLSDRDYPVAYEPSADDFLSPSLVEAVLMKRVMKGTEFEAWLKAFLPELGPLATPPRVTDHADPKHSHLDGLCLSRAWCFFQLGKTEEANRHLQAGMPHVVGGDYAGEHWLATFAVLALSAEARKTP